MSTARRAAVAALWVAALAALVAAGLALARARLGGPASIGLGAAECALLAAAVARACGGPAVPWGAAAAAGFAALCRDHARVGVVGANLVSHSVIYGGVAVVFGRSLLRGRVPLVVAMARRTEPAITPAIERYARGVTWLWTGFGVAQLAVSWGLLAMGRVRAWTVFVTVLDVPLLLGVFAAEYAMRRWVLRGERLAPLRDTVLAFSRRGREEA